MPTGSKKVRARAAAFTRQQKKLYVKKLRQGNIAYRKKKKRK